MEKEFYIGQPLIIKDTGERVIFAYNASQRKLPCSVVKKGNIYNEHYDYEDVEPSPEFTFSEICAGLEQGYFEAGTEFKSEHQTLFVGETLADFALRDDFRNPLMDDHWTLVEPRKEMTLDEVEAELGYKIKLKNYA